VKDQAAMRTDLELAVFWKLSCFLHTLFVFTNLNSMDVHVRYIARVAFMKVVLIWRFEILFCSSE